MLPALLNCSNKYANVLPNMQTHVMHCLMLLLLLVCGKKSLLMIEWLMLQQHRALRICTH